MFGAKVKDSTTKRQTPLAKTKPKILPKMTCPKINIINKEGMVEHHNDCSSPCDCDEHVNMNTVTPVPDTVWKIGCYKINPSTPSGNVYFL